MLTIKRPTKAELLAARNKVVPDVIAPGLKVLFCGINPGLFSAWAGHHFARPGNRFWPALYAAGFTGRLLSPEEESELLKQGYGITNIVSRASAAAQELSRDELRKGARRLEEKVVRYRIRILAVLGVTAYRTAFNAPDAIIGVQARGLGTTKVWVLPNPSGLNAHFTPATLADLYRGFRLQATAG